MDENLDIRDREIAKVFAFMATTVAKLSKGKSVTMDTIERICCRFDVQPGDLMECIPKD